MNEQTESTPTVSPKTKKKGGKFTIFLAFLILLLLGGLAATGFMYYQTRQQLRQLTQPGAQEELAKREIQAVVQRLGKLVLLPEEEPVVATIIDSAFLATQSAFYAQAQNGDKLVIYPQAQKAFVYSPERNIIVNSGPLVLDNESGTAEPTTEGNNRADTTEESPVPSASPAATEN